MYILSLWREEQICINGGSARSRFTGQVKAIKKTLHGVETKEIKAYSCAKVIVTAGYICQDVEVEGGKEEEGGKRKLFSLSDLF